METAVRRAGGAGERRESSGETVVGEWEVCLGFVRVGDVFEGGVCLGVL